MDAKGLKLALAYKEYEKRAREAGLLSFDDLIYFMVDILEKKPEVRARHQYLYTMVDEAQDCSKIEWDLLKLITQKHGNLLCVGDAGQCHPAGTLIECNTFRGWARGGVPGKIESVPIETVKDGFRALTWGKHNRLLLRGRTGQVASRPYEGDLIVINAGGKTTKVTPDHQVFTRLNMNGMNKYVVYLMWKEGLGFRIGQCNVAKPYGKNPRNTIRVWHRLNKEKPDRFWILRVCDGQKESLLWERILASEYGITQTEFNPHSYLSALTEEEVKFVFSHLSGDGARKCLQDHGLSFEFPFLNLQGEDRINLMTRFIKTSARNLIPDLMEVPVMPETYTTEKAYMSYAPVTSITREPYSGLVYSLNVEEHHRYVSDGIGVANCIYGFRGSDSKLFLDMENMFPGTQTLMLATNYRSSQEIVSFLKEIGPIRELAEKFHTGNASGPKPQVHGFLSAGAEAEFVVKSIKEGM
jgi:hypothetical protein